MDGVNPYLVTSMTTSGKIEIIHAYARDDQEWFELRTIDGELYVNKDNPQYSNDGAMREVQVTNGSGYRKEMTFIPKDETKDLSSFEVHMDSLSDRKGGIHLCPGYDKLIEWLKENWTHNNGVPREANITAGKQLHNFRG